VWPAHSFEFWDPCSTLAFLFVLFVCVCGGGLDLKETCCVCYIFGSALLFQVSLAYGIIPDDDDDETLKALNIMTMLLEKSTQT